MCRGCEDTSPGTLRLKKEFRALSESEEPREGDRLLPAMRALPNRGAPAHGLQWPTALTSSGSTWAPKTSHHAHVRTCRGLNFLTKRSSKLGGAICGMVKSLRPDAMKPQGIPVACQLGTTTPAPLRAKAILETADSEVLLSPERHRRHAMEDMIREGVFEGVLD